MRKIKLAGLFVIVLAIVCPAFCGKASEERITHLIKSLSDEDVFKQQQSVETLISLGNEAVPALLRALESDDRDTCANAIEALGLIGENSTVPYIIKKLKEHYDIKGYDVLKDQYIRVNSIKALGRLKAREAIPILEDIMRKERPIDMAWSLIALYQIEATDSRIHSLFKMADSKDPTVRNIVIRFLSEQLDIRALPILKEALSDEEWYIRDTAVQGVGRLGGKEEIKILKPLLDDPVSVVAETTRIAINKLKNK